MYYQLLRKTMKDQLTFRSFQALKVSKVTGVRTFAEAESCCLYRNIIHHNVIGLVLHLHMYQKYLFFH